MSTHKRMNLVCIVAALLAVAIAFVFLFGEKLGLQKAVTHKQYETGLFDYTVVHTIDITMDDWDEFIEGCEDEKYVSGDLVIDGNAVGTVAIRAKGNTSLSSVSRMDSQRYSFKIEFDHYQKGKTYQGLDKLSLNNTIQDKTYMKDFLSYRMMALFEVDAPLCSYAYITVNGEDWGLYLAVEAVEESFLERNYGSNYGDLYKPDSTGFGGGRGNGQDFDMDNFEQDSDSTDTTSEETDTGSGSEATPDQSEPTAGSGSEAAADKSDSTASQDSGMPTPPDGAQPPDGFGGSGSRGGGSGGMNGNGGMPGDMNGDGNGGGPGGMNGDGNGGMGSDDVKLQYIDDDADSYTNIFDNAKTVVSDADQARLIAALKNLSALEDLQNTVDMDKVIRYFVVHNFVVNGDSYTGSMIHNYYLYEKNGQMTMIPWDYNLAYGTFQGNDASSAVNDPIDTPVSGGDVSDRPMVAWIFSDDTYTDWYHQYLEKFIVTWHESGYVEELIDSTAELIAPYVESDPTKFYTYEEFETGTEALKRFNTLRAESVRGQLEGTIPSTTDGQSEDSSSLVDASQLNISDLGTMSDTNGGDGMGGGPGGDGMNGNMGGGPGGFRMDGNAEQEGATDGTAADGNAEQAGATDGTAADDNAEQAGTTDGTAADGNAEQAGTTDGTAADGNADKTGTTGSTAEQQSDTDSASNPMAETEDQRTASSSEDSEFGQMPHDMQTDSTDSSVNVGTDEWILFGISVLVLLAGIVVAALYRHRS